MGKVKTELGAYGKLDDLTKSVAALEGRDDIAQQAAIADLASETAADIVAKVNAILAALRSAGVIAAS